MIEKERLEELIEEGEKIWSITNGRVFGFPTSKRDYFDTRLDGTIIYSNDKYNADLRLENLYETQEDAEWVAKRYTTRLELFEPPTWEEFVEMEEWCFWKKNHRQTVIRILGTKYIAVETSYERFFTGDLTKENYIKAVEMAYKLFKGEE